MFDDFNAALQQLGEVLMPYIDSQVNGPQWLKCELTVRYHDNGFSKTIELTTHSSNVLQLPGSQSIDRALMTIGGLRDSMGERFNGLLVSVNAEGEFNVELDCESHNESAGQQMPEPDDEKDEYWQSVYNARHTFFQNHFGPLPEDILKIVHMFGVWPGGGLFQFQATSFHNLWMLTTFGLSNPDMPATVCLEEVDAQQDEMGRPSQTSSRLVAKENPPVRRDGMAGYGYEMIILTPQQEEWPQWVMQWVCNSELLSDVDFFGRVATYDGVTVESIRAGEDLSVNVLFAEAQPPLPGPQELPNGQMKFLVATVITDEEMQFSFDNSRSELLQRLMQSGVGQTSIIHRNSVV